MAKSPPRRLTIGVISDTHGLLRPEAVRALAGVDRIIHAGDIGGPEILEALRMIAPVDAVRGNNDTGPWARAIPEELTLGIEGVGIRVLHDLKQLDRNRITAATAVVIAGHSHRPAVLRQDSVLYVNPGSAGPRRFSLPVTVALLQLAAGTVEAHIRPIV